MDDDESAGARALSPADKATVDGLVAEAVPDHYDSVGSAQRLVEAVVLLSEERAVVGEWLIEGAGKQDGSAVGGEVQQFAAGSVLVIRVVRRGAGNDETSPGLARDIAGKPLDRAVQLEMADRLVEPTGPEHHLTVALREPVGDDDPCLR